MASRVLTTESLTVEAFAPFGQVIAPAQAARHFTINQGYAERFDDLAHIDVGRESGRPRLSIFRARPRVLPMALLLLERHVFGSQAFVPLSAHPYLVVVCAGGDSPDLASLRCFRPAPGVGINYAAGTWHHPLLALASEGDFVVVDRGGPEDGADCEEVVLPDGAIWIDGTVKD